MDAKFQYILALFERVYGLDAPLDIGYGLEVPAKIRVRRAKTKYFWQKAPLDTREILWKRWKGQSIPFLFDREDKEIVTWSEEGATINYDLIAAAFYFLSGWQEYVTPARDHYGRFPYTASLQHQLGLTTIPVVNYYFDILKTVVEQVYGFALKVSLWQGADMAIFLTHDIDKVDSAWKEDSFSALKKGRLLAPISLLAKKVFRHDDWFNFREILAIERRFGVPSTFFFLCRKGGDDGFPNADYDVREARFEPVMDHILASGAEIGLHGSWGTHTAGDELQKDLRRLGRPVVGNRFHFLNFDVARTPALLEEAGFLYDTTLGFSEHYGFRNGFCFPFYLYDIERDRPTRVLEIPLVLMDTTLTHYLHVRSEAVLDVVSGLMAEVKKFQGCFSVLWHNNYFSKYKYDGWKDHYLSILQRSRQENAIFMTGRGIAERFTKTDSIKRI